MLSSVRGSFCRSGISEMRKITSEYRALARDRSGRSRRFRHELHRRSIHAVAQAGRLRPIIEDVPEMAKATCAMNFRAFHEKRPVRLGLDGIGERLIKAWPAGTALKFRIGREQRQIAAGADESALALLLVQRAASGAFRTMLAQDRVLVGVKALAPIHIGQIAKVDRIGRGHSFGLAKFSCGCNRCKRYAGSQ